MGAVERTAGGRGTEMITASAIKIIHEGAFLIVTGKRHCNCFEKIYHLGIRRPFEEEQGFMTDDFRFMDRHEAYKYADERGQIKEGTDVHPGTLYSEDLW